MTLTWDPLQKVGTTLSNGNKTATIDNNANLGGQGGVRGNIGYIAEKRYLEFTINSWDPSGSDSPAVGFTDGAGESFPGNPVGQGVGFSNNDYYYNPTEGGTWGAHGSLVAWVKANVFMSAGPRYGLKYNGVDGWWDIISLLAPEGTHQLVGDGGHDAYVFFTPGTRFYPTAGMPFGNGADHSYTITIYGDAADFVLPHDAAFLPWGLVAPVADFSGTPLTGTSPLTVAFTDLSTNAPTSWAWDFGDGGVSTLQNPTHAFAPGVYTIKLTATNAAGSNTKTISNYVIVSVAPVPGLPSLMSQAPISAALLGITAGVRCGAAAGGGNGYAVISPLMRTVTVVSLATPGVPAIKGTITLPLSPRTIAVDTSDGLTLYVYGHKTLWIITLASLVPTLAATHDMPAAGGGGVDIYSLPGGVYEGTIGPFLHGGHSVSNDTTTFVHDQDRQLLYIYTRSGSSPYLTLTDRVPTSGIQGIRSMRLGVVATMGGSDARLFIVTKHYLYTFALDGTLLLTTRNDDSVLNDYLAVQDPISSAYKAHLAGDPYIEGQTGAPLYGVDENFLGALDNGSGTIVVSANAKLGRLTVWQ